MSEQNSILVELGKLSEAVAGLRRETDAASVSRKEMYERMETTNRDVSELAHELKTTNDRLDRLTDTLQQMVDVQTQTAKELKPIIDLRKELPGVVENWRDLRKWSRRVVYLLSIGGVSILGGLAAFGGLVGDLIKQWLGIVPHP